MSRSRSPRRDENTPNGTCTKGDDCARPGDDNLPSQQISPEGAVQSRDEESQKISSEGAVQSGNEESQQISSEGAVQSRNEESQQISSEGAAQSRDENASSDLPSPEPVQTISENPPGEPVGSDAPSPELVQTRNENPPGENVAAPSDSSQLPTGESNEPAEFVKQICKFYKQGYCGYGENCFFSHELPAGESAPRQRSRSRGRQENQEKTQKRITVPASASTAIVGRGGHTIKRLIRESGAKIALEDAEDDAEVVSITLEGTPDAINAAMEAIEEVIQIANGAAMKEDNGSSYQKANKWQDDDSSGWNDSGWKSKKWNDGDGDNDWKSNKWNDDSSWDDSKDYNSWGGKAKKTIHIPHEFVGMLIGKGGETIKGLQEQSGAEINIAKKSDGEEDPLMKEIQVNGASDAVEKAIGLIEGMVGRAVGKAGAKQTESTDLQAPPGYTICENPGYLYNRSSDVYFDKSNGSLCWLNPSSGKFAPYQRGLELPYSFRGHGLAKIDKGAKNPAPKNVVIPDLHRVATALKMNLDHLDRPAALVGVYGNPVGGNGVPADVIARTYHEKLLNRLCSYRSHWQDTAFLPALQGALVDIATANEGRQPTGSVALVVGHRVAAVATPGSKLCVFTGALEDAKATESDETDGFASCYQEVGLDLTSGISVVLAVGQSCLDTQQIMKAAGPHLYQSRCRAANLGLVRAVQEQKAVGSVAFASARVRPVVDSTAVAALAAQPGVKVRIQQVLIRYWKGTGAKPNDPVRRKQISRTLEEAEMVAVEVLDKLIAGAPFNTVCRNTSECQSALKGGGLAGDLGWLESAKDAALKEARNERVVLQDVVKYVVPEPVLKASATLQVGELSDLVTSELGVHLLWRTG